MEIIQKVLFLQNKDLVTKIAEDMYITQEDKDTFINKYLKKNFCLVREVNKDPIETYARDVIICVQKKLKKNNT
jgi:hypothetical protein